MDKVGSTDVQGSGLDALGCGSSGVCCRGVVCLGRIRGEVGVFVEGALHPVTVGVGGSTRWA